MKVRRKSDGRIEDGWRLISIFTEEGVNYALVATNKEGGMRKKVLLDELEELNKDIKEPELEAVK